MDPLSLGSPWVDLGLVVWKGYRPRVRLVLALGHASAWFSPFWRGPAPGAQRYQAEMEYAQNELLVPVVYPDGIEISSDVGEELHDVRENCFPRSS